MKTKLFIALLLLQTSLCFAYRGESATKEIKDAISTRFNQWLVKSEFEKNSDYEIRLKNSDEKLKEITKDVLTSVKSRYLKGIHYGRFGGYNVDDETYLIKVLDDSLNITIKIPPSIAKDLTRRVNVSEMEQYSNQEKILIFPVNIEIINDKWVITDAVLVFNPNGGDHFGSYKIKIQSGGDVLYQYGDQISLTKPFDLKKITNGELPKSGLVAPMDVYYYKWKISEQPNFIAASNKPVSFSLEDLNIALPITNTNIISTPKLQVSDLDISAIKTSNSNPTAFAVVIGNKDYLYTKKVSYALNDAETMKKYLVNVLGYTEGNIFFIENATKSTFETYFGNKENPQGKLFNNMKQGISDVFVYYSGHGAPGLNDNKGYFVPVDCDPQYVQQGGYSLDLFYANIAKLNAKSVTIVTDACFSGAEIFKDISPITITVSNPIAVADNCVVLSSSAGSQVSSWYNDKQHGMFTYFFLKALQDKEKSDKNKDGKLTFEEIYEYVSDKTEGVPYYARSIHGVDQTPTIQGTAKDNTFIEYK
ncbi:MAG: caspase family protein [Paludibacter sp.]